MTAPAVVPRWSEPRPAPAAGSAAPARQEAPRLASECGPVRWRRPARHWVIGSVVRERLVAFRGVAPLGAVVVTGLVLQAGVAPHLAVRESAPDVLLVLVAAVAVLRGPRAGAGFGFAAGLGADLFLATPLGTSALAYTVIGHVLGQRCRPRSSETGAALCTPTSTCFACRTGRRHPPDPPALHEGTAPPALHEGTAPGAVPPARLRRRLEARRARVRRAVVLTAVGVGAGRLAVAVVATTLAGVPFPGAGGLLGIATVAGMSALLGPPAFAAVRRVPDLTGNGGRR